MSIATEERTKSRVFNVPNQLTALRLMLAVVTFVFIPLAWYAAALVMFVLAASTDWVDGYWARKYGQITTVGRIFDPFVDKIIICGTFIFLASIPLSGVAAWMAVVVVSREMLVTALRNFLEGEGADFSAQMSGKLKMVLQCTAATLSLFALALAQDPRPTWLAFALPAAVWLAVLLTVYSGLEYLWRAAVILRRIAS